MAFRIRKSFKIAPGIRLNVSKSGLSTSIGGKGATVNLSKRGTKVTSSLPGTGLSSSKLFGGAKSDVTKTAPTPMWAYIVTWLIIAAVLWAIFR